MRRPPVARRSKRLSASLATVFALLALSPVASAAQVSEGIRFQASDGVSVQTTISGDGPLSAKPVIVEFSPYGRRSGTFDGGPAYNHLLVQIRGTGDSDGRFDALGPRTQADVAEVLAWACRQPWSDGRLGLNGFSASAITIYNSLHLPLPCVRTAVLKSGTHELYRDLIYPGGISNLIAGAGVITLIGAPALAQSGDRLGRDPASGFDAAAGIIGTGISALQHPALDGFWRERGFRGNANDLPVLVVNGFFDVESRGAFEGYQELRDDGAHLAVVGAHDGAPAGTDAGLGKMSAWFDRHLRGVDNGVEREPRAELLLADGDREDMLNGRFVRFEGSDWPVPGTRWQPLALDPVKSGTAGSLNDGSLGLEMPTTESRQSYPAIPSLPTMSDPPNTAIAGGFGVNALTNAFPVLSEMTLAETLSLSYTTPALGSDVLSAGPAALELNLASSASQTGIWAVLSDVAEDGVAHPMTVGRLNSDFPAIDEAQSLKDPASGDVVQPYGDYTNSSSAPAGAERRYRIEFWPVGNRFKKGHRIRLDILGASAASAPGAPVLNTVRAGGANGSRLLFPVLPGSDLSAALGGPATRAAEVRKPKLRVSATPRRLRSKRSRRVRFEVRSAERSCMRRALLRVAGRRARTNARGVARLRLRVQRSGRVLVRATRKGCRGARSSLIVRRR